jgi:hypothetical protein
MCDYAVCATFRRSVQKRPDLRGLRRATWSCPSSSCPEAGWRVAYRFLPIPYVNDAKNVDGIRRLRELKISKTNCVSPFGQETI